MRILLLGIFFYFSLGIFAQNKNLVINPSFESYTNPAISTWPSVTQPGEEIVPGWVTPTRGTTDYFNSDFSLCDGSAIAKARTGQGRVAFLAGLYYPLEGTVNYKEYVQGKFSEPLEAGKKYCVKFYVALDRSCDNTGASIGAYISSDAIRSNNKEPLQVNPQIVMHKLISAEDGWTEISGTYIANGGEQYITLGSFTDTTVVPLSEIGKYSQTDFLFGSAHIMRGAYFYLDDVSVALDDGKNDIANSKNNSDANGDYYLFLLDVSGSMKQGGHLDLMKSEIIRFTQGLNENNKIGVMEFSDNAKFLLPFVSPFDSIEIDTTINHMKSFGSTNGSRAIRRVCEVVDSMNLSQRTHVIIATDGIFHLTEKTKTYADSILEKNNTSFCVLEFGNVKNEDLMEIAAGAPDGSFNYANKRDVPKILDQQLPPPAKNLSTVYYTDTSTAITSPILDNFFRELSK